MDRDAQLLKQQSQLSELTSTQTSLQTCQVFFFSLFHTDVAGGDAGDPPEVEGGVDISLDGAASSAFVAPGDERGVAALSPGERVGDEGVVSPGVRAAEEQRLDSESAAAALRSHGAS